MHLGALKDRNGNAMLLVLRTLHGQGYKLAVSHGFSLVIFDNCERESRLPLLMLPNFDPDEFSSKVHPGCVDKY